MNTRTLTKRPTVQLPTLPRLLLLALFFLAGVLLGQVLSGRVPDTTGTSCGGIWRTTSAWGARERPLSRRLCRPW